MHFDQFSYWGCRCQQLIIPLLLATTLGLAEAAEEQDFGDEYVLNPLKPADTSSPRATLESFINNMKRCHVLLMEAHEENGESGGLRASKSAREKERRAEEIFRRCVACLNLTDIPEGYREGRGVQVTLMLKEILDRIPIPPSDEIPDASEGDNLLQYRIPDTEIIIERVNEGPLSGDFLFSKETVRRISRFYRHSSHLSYKADGKSTPGFLDFYSGTPGHLLPPKWTKWLPTWSQQQVFGQTIWQWFTFFFSIVAAFLVLRALFRKGRSGPADGAAVSKFRNQLLLCLSAVGVILALRVALAQINITGDMLALVHGVFNSVSWVLLAIAMFALVRLVGEKTIDSQELNPNGIKASYFQALSGVIGFLFAATIVIFGLSRLGVALGPLLAGAGIGGLAVALAARPTLECVIGSFTIFVDEPFRVGERIVVLGHDGVVERIGLRSTQLRLSNGHCTSIPNEKMAATDIENIGRRPFIRRDFDVTVHFDTPPEKIRKAVAILEGILELPEGEGADHPNAAVNDPEYPPRVHFNRINDDSLNIAVSYWFRPPDWWAFMEHSDRTNIKIMDRFAAAGIRFSMPSQSVHLYKSEDLSEEA